MAFSSSSKNRPFTVLGVYWEYTKRHPWMAAACIGVMVASETLFVAVPVVYKVMVDQLSSIANPMNVPFSSLAHLLLLALVLRAGGILFMRSSGILLGYLEPLMMVDLEQYGLSELLSQSHRFFTDAFTGSLVKRIHRFSRAFKDIAESLLWVFLPPFTSAVCIIVLLFLRNRWIGLAAFIWIVLFGILNIFIARSKLELNRERAMKDSEASGAMSDALANNLNVLLFNGLARELTRTRIIQDAWRRCVTKSWYFSVMGYGLQNAINLLTEGVMMYLGLRLWRVGQITVGDLVLLQSFLLTLFAKLHELGSTMRKTYESMMEAQEMVDVLNMQKEIQNKPGATPLLVSAGRIVFDQVSFKYGSSAAAGTHEILRDLSFSIKSGEKIALVGPSGAGKSTLVKLLFRFYDLTQGSIFIDGQSVSDVTQESLRAQMSLVPQDPVLFHRSLRENISYSRPEATEEEIIEASKKAHCHEFISNLPHGYDTFVGERGVKLSGGERQRVAIARAILQDAPILVLDEATSSLDSESESLIQDALETLMKRKTVIVIAHRLSTIRQMDRILVMEDGSITHAGSHKELLARPGKYRTLWQIQAGSFAGAE